MYSIKAVLLTWKMPKIEKKTYLTVIITVELYVGNVSFLLLYKTNRLHFAMCLFNFRSQRTLKCGKNLISNFLSLPHSAVFYDL